MNMTEISAAIKSIAENDQSIVQADIDRWVDAGIQKINQACQSSIPTVTGKAVDYIPEFDARYHDSLVLFGIARYRESDADYNGATYFNNQFDDMVKGMQRDMVIPPRLRADYNYQQIEVTTDGVMTYNLTMPEGSYFDEVVVYLWDVEVEKTKYSLNLPNRTITFKGVSLWTGDAITIKFENNSDLNNPPYQWWGW